MHIVDTEDHRDKLEAVIRAHSPRPADLLIVPRVAEWCAERNGECSGDPIAMAITDGASGHWGILLRRHLTESAIDNVFSRMEIGGHFWNCREQLRDPTQFLKHTVLHELAHLANDWSQDRENECDQWAFERLEGAI
jgi:hypothetical protein